MGNKSLADYFKSIDRLIDSPRLNVNGDSRYKSCCGAFCTLLAWTIVLGGALYYISEYFANPVAAITFDNTHPGIQEHKSYDMRASNLFPQLELVNKSAMLALTYFTPTFQFFTDPLVNGREDVDQYFKLSIMVPCDSMNDDQYLRYYQMEKGNRNLTGMFCVNSTELDQYPKANIANRHSLVTILPCIQEFSDQCMNASKQGNSSRYNVRLYSTAKLYYPEAKFDYFQSTSKSYNRFKLVDESRAIGFGHRVRLGANRIVVEDYLTFPQKKHVVGEHTSFKRVEFDSKYKCNSMIDGLPYSKVNNITSDAPQCYMVYISINSLQEESFLTVTRRYKSIMNVWSSIGGFFAIIWKIFPFIYKYLFARFTKYDFTNSFFKLKKEAKEMLQKKER